MNTYQSMSQTIDSEQDKDKNCKNYPIETFKSFGECDDLYVKTQVESFNVMPFWATKNLSSVTSLR